MGLKDKKCVPCEGGVPKLTSEQAEGLIAQLEDWFLEGEQIGKTFEFKDFKETMKFVNKMAEVAEEEGHHPDFCVHYSEVAVTIWTHAIEGLSENDFILAAKLDEVYKGG